MADGDTLLRDLETVLAISRAMGSERDLDRLLELIIHSGSDLIGAEPRAHKRCRDDAGRAHG